MNEDFQHLLDYAQQLMLFLQEFRDEMSPQQSESLSMVLQQVLEIIEVVGQEQQGGGQPVPPPEVPPLTNSYPSSNVNSFSFDDKTGKLFVKFNGKDNRDDGPVYQYSGLSPFIFDLFRKGAVPARTNGSNKWGNWWKGKVPSVGASLYTLISSQNFPYQKVA